MDVLEQGPVATHACQIVCRQTACRLLHRADSAQWLADVTRSVLDGFNGVALL